MRRAEGRAASSFQLALGGGEAAGPGDRAEQRLADRLVAGAGTEDKRRAALQSTSKERRRNQKRRLRLGWVWEGVS